jgi:hypothetical protein
MLTMLILTTAAAAAPELPESEEPFHRLDAMVTEAERAELLDLLAEVEPPEAVRELAGYGDWQHRQGGGFHGLMPDQSEQLAALPIPVDEGARVEAAAVLAGLRRANREQLIELGYPLEFAGRGIEAPLEFEPPASIRIMLDDSAIRGFLAAVADGTVDDREASSLAALPSNREMMRHRRDLGYVPEPLVTADGLAAMLRRAGSGRPLDRLWAWINPLNQFGYADLVNQQQHYEEMMRSLDERRDALVAAAAGRIAVYLPAGVEVDEVFALTVGCLIRGWATSEMSGLNVEQVKDDWQRLARTMTEEVYHRVQLQLMPTASGAPANDFDDLTIAVDDPGLSKLYELLVYTVAEGSANLVATPAAGVDDPERARAGRDLLDRFVATVVRAGLVDEADAMLGEGLRSNGPLYALGFRMARTIERHDGAAAVGALQQLGPVAFVRRALDLASADGAELVGSDSAAAVAELAQALASRPVNE